MNENPAPCLPDARCLLGGGPAMAEHTNNYPKLHNAMWPGVVGKGSGDGEPFIDLDTLLELTSKAEYDGQRFDGVDLWLADPHISIDSSPDDIKRVIEKFQTYN